MKRVLTSRQTRDVERAAEESFGMPSALLMENAGAALAEEALRVAGPDGRIAVLCGRGNNGGDGLVAARRLAARGRRVQVEILGGPEALSGEPRRNALALGVAGLTPSLIPAGAPFGPGDVVIDALLGTGLNRAPQGAYAEAIGRIAAWRSAGARVVAADLPSGLDADSGLPFDPCVQADVTVSFGFLKTGQVLEPGASRCGELRVVEIGLPEPGPAGIDGPLTALIEEADARGRLPARRAEAHKGTYGHVLLVAGSPGKTGAAALAAQGALRGGAGLVTVATRPEALGPIMAHAPEMMGVSLPAGGELGPDDLDALRSALGGKQALVIGPGIPRGDRTAELIGALLAEAHSPCVIDADGLNALAGRLDLLKNARGPLVLTPHPGEMARLVGRSTAQVQQDRLGVARELASVARAVVVFKGARTVIARADGTAWINPTGNPGMATGGTGDVLAGLCGALLAQGLSPEDAAIVATYAHGLAGDRAARRTGQTGLIASDLFAGLGEVWAGWER